MRTLYILVLAVLCAGTANAQISASVSGNYTMYKGSFQQKTPGVKVDVGYQLSEKKRAAISFTYHLPIKTASTLEASNGFATKDLASEIKYKFMSFALTYNHTFVGDEETPFQLYVPISAGFVMAKYTEAAKESVPAGYTAMDGVEGKESGFTMGLGLGAQYNLGKVSVFGDAGIALPANRVNDQYVANYMPTHFMFNAGVRIPFGGGSND